MTLHFMETQMHSSGLVANIVPSAQQEFERPTVWQRRGVLSLAAAHDEGAHVRSLTRTSVRARWIRSERGLELCFAPHALATASQA
jgi:hypothetical protein